MRALPFLLLSLCVSGCGQTGDLYLPQKTPQASAQPASDEANKKKAKVPSPATAMDGGSAARGRTPEPPQPDPQPVPQEVR